MAVRTASAGLAGAAFLLAAAAPAMVPLPAELESLAPCLAARRLSVADFFQSRHQWAALHGYRKLEVRVRQLNREAAWVRVDFDQAREGKAAGGEVFRMAWNEGEEGPAPFAHNQRLWIWVSPEGSVDGFELGHAVHRWRHRADGAVELLVLDELADGGAVLVRMIPDRYSGSEVGKTVYWKGEGLCTGAAGAVPAGRKVHPDDLAAAEAGLGPDGKKTAWVRPGMTSCEDEIRILLRDFAAPAKVIVSQDVTDAALLEPGLGEPFKVRLRSDGASGLTTAPGKKLRERQAAAGAGWGRATAPAAARKSAGQTEGAQGALASFFGKGNKDKKGAEEKPAAKAGSVPAQEGAGSSGEAASRPETATPASSGQPAGEMASAPASAEQSEVRFDEGWFEVLRQKAIQHRRQAFETLSRSRSPGSAISQSWVQVVYENQPGEPLRTAVATLPLVPKEQWVPEARGCP